MIKYKSFYHIVIKCYSAKSGDTLSVIDDYYTPHVIGVGKELAEFQLKTERMLDLYNTTREVEDYGGKFDYEMTTCCFNNGCGRSVSAQTNIEPYLVRDKNNQPPKLGSLFDDKVVQECMTNAIGWLKEQEPPF